MLGTVVIAAGILTACPTDSGGGDDGDPESFLGLTVNKTFSGITTSEAIDFTYIGNSTLSDLFNPGAEAKLTADGKFTLKLTEPKTLLDVTDFFGSGLTITEGLQILNISTLYDGGSSIWTKYIMWRKDANNSVLLTYANKDGSIKGTDSYGDTVNISLKKGWNTAIVSMSGSNGTAISGKPDASYKWVVLDKP
ncbi:MAG: hypothetical protein LBB89_05975 [Treponema sp.]|jgi:hypothetical protein|nr:hypothetical protein [Treponema sp.]